MMKVQQNIIDFDLKKIQEELKQENINVCDNAIQIPNAYILKQYHVNGKEKLFLKQYRGIFVELNSEEELNHNNNNAQNSKTLKEYPEIFNEHTLETKQQWRTAQYIYKKSNSLLFSIDQWKIYIIQQKDGMNHIFRLFSKIFQIINHLWQNHQQYQINLDLNNFALDSDNKIIIFNQSDIQDKKSSIAEQEENYIYQFGNFMLEILKDIYKFIKEQTPQEKIILNSCCEFLKLIFQNKIQNLNQIRINFYEVITKIFFSYIDEDKIYSESYEIYKNQFKIYKNKNKEFSLPQYYKNRNLEFDFKQVKTIETECQNNITQNTNTLKNYLILSSINSGFKRNYLQSVEYLNKAIELEPYDIDILIGFMKIFIHKRSKKMYLAIRFSLIYLSDLFQDYWLIYYSISSLYNADSLVKESQEYMIKTYKLNTTDPEILWLNADIQFQQKQLQKSKELIDQAIAQNTMNNPIVYFKIGYTQDLLNIDGYQEWYYKSLEINPLDSDNYFAIAFYYQNQNNIEKSIEFFDKCLALNPNETGAYLNQSDNYGLLDDKKKQKQYLEKAIEANPDSFEGYYNLGLYYRQQQNYSEAMKMWNKTIELNPIYADAYYYYAQQLESFSVIQYYKKYIILNNNNYEDESYFFLSLEYFKEFDFESSELCALEVIKNSNTNQFINEILCFLCDYREGDSQNQSQEFLNNDYYDEIVEIDG